MRKNIIVSFLIIVGISTVLSSLVYLIFCEIKIETIVLIVTTVTVFWYAFETQQMRKEMVDQKEISTMPIFYISEEIETGGRRHALFIENCGNFPAFNVKIQDIKIEAKLKNKVSVLKFVFHEFGLVPKGEKIPIVFDISKDEKKGNEIDKEFFEPHLFEGFAEHDFEVPMTYENILGHRYRVILKMGRSGSSTGKPERITKEN